MQRLRPLALAVLAWLAIAMPAVLQAGPAFAGNAKAPVVVELFTSQGCNSCPPADAVLADLTGQHDVITLSYHVNYWDYLGWKDTFATPETTQRQRDYAKFLNERTIYTPQIVIGGRTHIIGSRKDEVMTGVATAAQAHGAKAGKTPLVAMEKRADGKLTLRVAAAKVQDVAVILVRYDTRREVAIERGENRGKTFTYHNVVRDIRTLASWNGQAMEMELDPQDLWRDGRDGCAVLLQDTRNGQIIAANRLEKRGG
jgi:hypothetical protein